MQVLLPVSNVTGPTRFRALSRVYTEGLCGPALLVLLIFLSAFKAEAEVPKEYQLRAVLLWRLAQFVQWPTSAFATRDSPLVIGVLGENPFGEALEIAVRGQQVHGRKMLVQYYRHPEDIKTCHILYVSTHEAQRWKEIQPVIRGRSILTVGDDEGFTLSGGMVRFMTEANRVNFRVNVEAARAAGLVIDSKLLRFAEIVRTQQ